jgi:two-component system chemotaxis response regulator CheY
MVRVLVADDSEALRTMFQETLVSEGFEVVVAADGQEAFDLFHTAGPFDLVLLDGDMPRLTGREIARKLRAEGFGRPVVIVSGTVHISETEAQALGVTFLLKPVLPNGLVREIRRLLGIPGP